MAVSDRRLREILGDPTWHPHRVNAELSEISFVRLDRNARRAITFLEDKFFAPDIPSQGLPLAAIRQAVGEIETTVPRFIFHSSMATSTLMSRVFDLPGLSMNLSEPIILNGLSALNARGRDVRPALATIVHLLGRPFGPGEKIVIKPGNTSNNLMPLIVALSPDVRAVTIHAPIRDFLRSIAKKGMTARIIYRRLYAFISRTHSLPTGFSPEDVFEQTDFQIAAMTWLLQQSQFLQLIQSRPAQVRSIDSATFLARKADALAALADHFDIPLDAREIAAGPVFSTHAKELGRAFDATQREREYAATDAAYGEEMGMVATWIEAVADHVRVPLDLPNPLLAR